VPLRSLRSLRGHDFLPQAGEIRARRRPAPCTSRNEALT